MTLLPAAGRRFDVATRERAAWIALGIVWACFYTAGFFFNNGRPNWEEVRDGNLAVGLIDGLAGSVRCYQYGPSAGTLFYGALLTAPYLLTGSHVLWIKLIGALLIGSGIICWTILLRRFWGFRTAALFLAMMTLPTSLFARYSHTFFANHAETIFFSGLAYLLMFPKGNAPPGWPRTTALALTTGLGTFFCYQNIAVAAVVAALLPWRWGRRGLVQLAVFAPIAAGTTYALMGFKLPLGFFRPDLFWSLKGLEGWIDFLVTNLFRYDLQRAYWPDDQGFIAGFGRFYAWVAFATLLWGATRTLFRRAEATASRPKDWLAPALAIQAAAWLAGAAISDFHFMDRYVLSLYPVVIAEIACLASTLRPRYGWLVVAPFFIAGLLAFAADAPRTKTELRQNARLLWDRRGDDYTDIARHIAECASDDDETVMMKLPPRWRDYAWTRFGRVMDSTLWAEILRKGLWTERERRLFAFGQGERTAGHFFTRTDTPPDQAEAALAVAQTLDREAAEAFVAGIGLGTAVKMGPISDVYGHPPVRPLTRLPQLSEREFDAAFLRGLGAAVGNTEVPIREQTIDKIAEFGVKALEATPGPDLDAAFRAGVDEGLAWAVAADFNRIEYWYRLADLPSLRNILGAQGVSLRPVGGVPNYFAVEASPQ